MICLALEQNHPLERVTLSETNIFAPENGWLGDYFPFGKAYFQGRAVSLGRVKNHFLCLNQNDLAMNKNTPGHHKSKWRNQQREK